MHTHTHIHIWVLFTGLAIQVCGCFLQFRAAMQGHVCPLGFDFIVNHVNDVAWSGNVCLRFRSKHSLPLEQASSSG